MLKEVIDPNVKREANAELRRTIQEALKAQEFERGRRMGYDEGFEAGLQLGMNRAIEDFYNIVTDFAKGNRSFT